MVYPRSKRQSVERDGGIIIVRVRSPPVGGRANEEARALLADFLGVSKGRVRLISGHRSREKVFEVEA